MSNAIVIDAPPFTVTYRMSHGVPRTLTIEREGAPSIVITDEAQADAVLDQLGLMTVAGQTYFLEGGTTFALAADAGRVAVAAADAGDRRAANVVALPRSKGQGA